MRLLWQKTLRCFLPQGEEDAQHQAAAPKLAQRLTQSLPTGKRKKKGTVLLRAKAHVGEQLLQVREARQEQAAYDSATLFESRDP